MIRAYQQHIRRGRTPLHHAGLLLVAATLGVAAGGTTADAREYVWTAATYAPANQSDPLNDQIIPLRFPVLGEVLPGGFTYNGGPSHSPPGRDDFCEPAGRNPVDDPNLRCDIGWGHGGHDIVPKVGMVPEDYPIIAARNGTLQSSACTAGGGNTVTVLGVDGRWYSYLHMSQRLIVGPSVTAGQLVGRMGQSTNTSCSGATGYHLHFEVRQGPSNQGQYAIDVWRNLRDSYAFVGRQVDGVTHQNAFNLGWSVAVSQYTGYWNRMTNVGWPTMTPTFGLANVQTTSSSFGQPGLKQYLSIPFNNYHPDYVGGVNIKPSWSSTAFVVPRTVWVAYRNAGSEGGWLGFPTGHYANNRQNFQGGCIAHNGSGFVAAPTGSPLCP